MAYLLQIQKYDNQGRYAPKFLDVKDEHLEDILRKTFEGNSDESYGIGIVEVDNNEEKSLRGFQQYNNIKQILIYYELSNGRPFSSVRSLMGILRELDEIENKYQTPFYNFNKKQIQEFIDKLSEKGNTVYTISTKLSVIGRAVEELKRLFEENNLPKIKDNWWKKINRDRSNHAGLRKSNEKQFITETKLMNEILPSDDLELTIPILLAYKGLMMGKTPDTAEIMNLKWEDFNGAEIVIKGKRARTIKFSVDEMKFIDRYKANHSESPYVISATKTNKNGKSLNEPVKRWTVWKRMTQVAEKLGMSSRTLAEQNIRLSGQLNWILKEEVSLYGPYATLEQLNGIIYDSFIQFGAIKEELDNMSKKGMQTRTARMRSNLKQFEKSTRR